MTLWLLAVMPTVLPWRTSSQIICAPVKVLPAPGGPWIGRMPPARCAAEPDGGLDRRFSLAVQRLSADARALSQQQIARRLIGSVAAQAVVGDILADPHQRLRHHLRRRHSCGRTRPADGGRRCPAAS